MIIAAVGDQHWKPPPWSTTATADRRQRVHQRQELGDVVAVVTSHGHDERHAAAVADQMVLGAGLAAVDRARAGGFAPLCARTCEASTQIRDQSIAAAALRCASSS